MSAVSSERCQREIDRELEGKEQASYDDRNHMPYMQVQYQSSRVLVPQQYQSSRVLVPQQYQSSSRVLVALPQRSQNSETHIRFLWKHKITTKHNHWLFLFN